MNTGELMKLAVKRSFRRSIWIYPWLSGGCRGCHLEILDSMAPFYDGARLGLRLAPSVRQADIILFSGTLTERTVSFLPEIPVSFSGHGKILAVGACACGGGICFDREECSGPVAGLMPVDLFVPGCPPRPEAILHALALSRGIIPGRINPGKRLLLDTGEQGARAG